MVTLAVKMQRDFVALLNAKAHELGYRDRSQFIRDALAEKLTRMGVQFSPNLSRALSRLGKGGRRRKRDPAVVMPAPAPAPAATRFRPIKGPPVTTPYAITSQPFALNEAPTKPAPRQAIAQKPTPQKPKRQPKKR